MYFRSLSNVLSKEQNQMNHKYLKQVLDWPYWNCRKTAVGKEVGQKVVQNIFGLEVENFRCKLWVKQKKNKKRIFCTIDWCG